MQKTQLRSGEGMQADCVESLRKQFVLICATDLRRVRFECPIRPV